MESLEEKIQRVLLDRIELAPCDPTWPALFEEEKKHLQSCLPNELLGRIEHYGSTSIPGIMAKPVIDMLVEVSSLEETRKRIAPILEAQGYDYFWRPVGEDDIPPYYAWFIKRDGAGRRTHHIHMVESDFKLWEGLSFRNYLREHPETATAYEQLKLKLVQHHANDRIAYTLGKTEFIHGVLEKAME